MNEVEKLLEKYNNGTATKEEIILVESWYIRYKTSEGNLSHKQIEEEYKAGLADLSKRINANPVRLWPRIAAAASVLLMLSAGGYFLLHKQKAWQFAQNQLQDIAPGINHALLKTGHGKTIVLDNVTKGLVDKQGNTSINKTGDGQLVYNDGNATAATQMVYDTLIVPAGAKPYRLTLSDGSKLFVNVDSKVRFPERFASNERKIDFISGEAYFEVVHDAAKPLSVNVKGQIIKDIGTHFNINAYDNELSVTTTLLEGSVNIAKGKQNATLNPGQQAVVKTGNDNLIVKNADTEETMAWKDGKFLYTGARLETIMRQVERWYDVQVIYQDESLKSKTFSVISTRFGMVSQLLHNLEIAGDVKFKIEGKKITVLNK